MSANSTGIYSHFFKDLPADWQLLPFSDAVDFQEGPGILAVDFHENGVPLLRLSSITGNKTTFDGCNFLSPEKVVKKWSHFKLNEGDILLSTSGSLGRVSEVAKEQIGSLCYTGIIRFRPKVDGLKKSFIKYFLQSNFFERQASSSAAGSVLKHFGPSHLRKMSFPVPPEEYQAYIEQLIEPVDDQIDLNRRINQTLEAMAQAIFKSWFVDFDPVKAKITAKQEGRDPLRAAMCAISGKIEAELDALPHEQYTQLAATAALFPDEMEESELGEIPRGWATATLSTVCDINASSWNVKTLPAVVKYVDLANTKNGEILEVQVMEDSSIPSRARRILNSGDTIIGTVRPGNRSFALVGEADLTGSTGFAVLHPKKDYLREYVYLAATSDVNIERLAHLADGGAYPAVRPDLVICDTLPMPLGELLHDFHRVSSCMFDQILANRKVNKDLAELRDTLLPKLISGELSVTEAMAKIEA